MSFASIVAEIASIADQTSGKSSEPKPAPAPYAWTGTVISCPNGHEIARVLEPLVAGEDVQPRLHFPHGGSDMARFLCACGRSSYRWSHKLLDYQFHIKGEWLPKDGSEP